MTCVCLLMDSSFYWLAHNPLRLQFYVPRRAGPEAASPEISHDTKRESGAGGAGGSHGQQVTSLLIGKISGGCIEAPLARGICVGSLSSSFFSNVPGQSAHRKMLFPQLILSKKEPSTGRAAGEVRWLLAKMSMPPYGPPLSLTESMVVLKKSDR